MEGEVEVKRATAGFIVSLIAGILILINAILMAVALYYVAIIPPGVLETMSHHFIAVRAFGLVAALAALGLVCGVLVIIGAVLIYRPGKEVVGGILVLVFSILSIFIGGGFFIGLILGIVGGALGIAKK
mgnify:CR=1 FL=1